MKITGASNWQEVENMVRAARDRQARPIAAFDADGTLWNTDLGEALFAYQIRNKLVPLPPDPWEHYQNLKVQSSHEVAYLWLAQINKGLPIEQVRKWASLAVDELQPVPLFKEIKELIALLKSLECEIYIVTASIKWAVEPGATLVGLTPNNVIGIETAVENGLVTERQKGPITYKRGKVDGLLHRTGGVAPFLCAGNTEGDLSLLESAIDLRIVVAGSPVDDRNYSTERQMLKTANQRNWIALDYL